MKSLLFLLILSFASFGATTVDFQWDAPVPSTPPQVITKFNLYERNGTVITKLGETASGTTMTFRLNSVTSTPHTYYVTAVSAGGESVPSNEVTISAPPNAPVNLRITISITP